jgi:hypothetical protein
LLLTTNNLILLVGENICESSLSKHKTDSLLQKILQLATIKKSCMPGNMYVEIHHRLIRGDK